MVTAGPPLVRDLLNHSCPWTNHYPEHALQSNDNIKRRNTKLQTQINKHKIFLKRKHLAIDFGEKDVIYIIVTLETSFVLLDNNVKVANLQSSRERWIVVFFRFFTLNSNPFQVSFAFQTLGQIRLSAE